MFPHRDMQWLRMCYCRGGLDTHSLQAFYSHNLLTCFLHWLPHGKNDIFLNPDYYSQYYSNYHHWICVKTDEDLNGVASRMRELLLRMLR